MLFYSIRHLTKFQYGKPVSESVMEMRMHPRSDSNQRCLSFSLSVSPRCRVFSYRDHLGNNIHHFDMPGEHEQLVIVAESLVEQQPLAEVPSNLEPGAWSELDAIVAEGDYWEMLLPSEFARPVIALGDDGDYWEMLLPSEFARPTDALKKLAEELDMFRRELLQRVGGAGKLAGQQHLP